MRLYVAINAIFYFTLFLFLFVFLSCSTPRHNIVSSIPGEVEIGIPQGCYGPEYSSGSGFIRATCMGESIDMSISKKKAQSDVRAKLAVKIKVSVSSVVNRYTKSTEMNNTEDIESIYEAIITQTVNQNIMGVTTICEKVIKTSDGKFRTYLTGEIPVDNVINPVYDNLSNNEELKFKYDYHKFKQTIEEEIIKVDNQ